MSQSSAKQSIIKSLLAFFCLGILFLTWESLLAQDVNKQTGNRHESIIHHEAMLIDSPVEIIATHAFRQNASDLTSTLIVE